MLVPQWECVSGKRCSAVLGGLKLMCCFSRKLHNIQSIPDVWNNYPTYFYVYFYFKIKNNIQSEAFTKINTIISCSTSDWLTHIYREGFHCWHKGDFVSPSYFFFHFFKRFPPVFISKDLNILLFWICSQKTSQNCNFHTKLGFIWVFFNSLHIRDLNQVATHVLLCVY